MITFIVLHHYEKTNGGINWVSLLVSACAMDLAIFVIGGIITIEVLKIIYGVK